MQRILTSLMAIIIGVMLLQPSAFGAGIVVNGSPLTLTAQPLSAGGRLLVPMRGIFQALGAQVAWEEATKTVMATKAGQSVTIQLGSKNAILNGNIVTLDVPPRTYNNVTYVPLRFVSEAMGADVSWDGASQTAYIDDAAGSTATDAPTAPVTQPANTAELSPDRVAALAGPAVGYVEVYDSQGKAFGSGSFFTVSSDGTLITNYHVIDGASGIKVRYPDGKSYTVSEIKTYDIAADIAVLKINGTNLPTVTMGDSDKLVSGQKIITIGSPVGMENTVADGLVSHPSRVMEGQKLIQISAPISPGSSGGALLDMKGNVIGVTTLASVEGIQNLNFAVPINTVKAILATSKPVAPTTLAQGNQTSITSMIFCREVSADGQAVGAAASFSGVESVECLITLDTPLQRPGIARVSWYVRENGNWESILDSTEDISAGVKKFSTGIIYENGSMPPGSYRLDVSYGSSTRSGYFTVTQGGSTGGLPSLEAFTSYLEDRYNPLAIGGRYVYFDYLKAFWSDDSQAILISATVDSNNFLTLMEGSPSLVEARVESWLRSIIQDTASYYPQDRAYVLLAFADTFSNYPSGIDAQYIEWDANQRQWSVWMPMVQLDNYTGQGVRWEE